MVVLICNITDLINRIKYFVSLNGSSGHDQHTGVFISLQLLSGIRYCLMHILDILGEIRGEIKGLIFFLSINKINHGKQRNFKIINGIKERAIFLLFPCIKTIQQTDRINIHVRNICQFLGCQRIS